MRGAGEDARPPPPEPHAARPERGPAAVQLAVVAAVGLLAYSNTFHVPFQFDDADNIVRNPAVEGVVRFLGSSPAPSRFVAFFTFALNGSLHGHSVAGFHAFNLAVHLAAAACVFLLTSLACRQVAPGAPASLPPTAGLVAALLFVAHPIQTQAVTYIVQRLASLMTLFFVAAALAYAKAATSEGRARRLAFLGGAHVLALLALFTKENAVTLPAALIAVDLAVLPGTARQRASRLLPFVAVIAIVALALLAPARSVTAVSATFREWSGEGEAPRWTAYLLTQPAVVLRYLRLLVLPFGQNVDHDQPLYSDLFTAQVLLPFATLMSLLGVPALLAWRARRRSPPSRLLLLGISWFVVTLSVESSFIPLADVMVEHRVYLPSVGIFLAAGAGTAWGLARLAPRTRRAAAAIIAACILVLGATAWLRNSTWRDRLALWSDALEKSPRKSRPYVYVAQDLIDRGEYQSAIILLQKAIRLPRPAPHVFLNLGVAHARLGEAASAEWAYREGIARGGGAIAGGHLGLGLVLLESGRTDEACSHFFAELGVDPSSRQARENAAACRYAQGDVAGAASEWARLAAEDPANARVLYNLALAWAALGDVTRARSAFERFLASAGPGFAAEQTVARRWLDRVR